jgi:hypothetical protein
MHFACKTRGYQTYAITADYARVLYRIKHIFNIELHIS